LFGKSYSFTVAYPSAEIALHKGLNGASLSFYMSPLESLVIMLPQSSDDLAGTANVGNADCIRGKLNMSRTAALGRSCSGSCDLPSRFLIAREHEWPLSELIGSQKVWDKLFAAVLSKLVKIRRIRVESG
jgi:hypothetical protein